MGLYMQQRECIHGEKNTTIRQDTSYIIYTVSFFPHTYHVRRTQHAQ